MRTSLFPSDQKSFASFLAARQVPNKMVVAKPQQRSASVPPAQNNKSH